MTFPNNPPDLFKLLLKEKMGLTMKNFNIFGVHWMHFLLMWKIMQFEANSLFHAAIYVKWLALIWGNGIIKHELVVSTLTRSSQDSIFTILVLNLFCSFSLRVSLNSPRSRIFLMSKFEATIHCETFLVLKWNWKLLSVTMKDQGNCFSLIHR